MFNFLSVLDYLDFDLTHSINVSIRSLMAWLCGYVYDLIVLLYDLFETLSTVNILEGNSLVNLIYRRIGLILGIFMVFKLSFSLIKHLIDPNTFNDKKTGFVQIIKRFIITIVLLGVTPTIFKEAFNIQHLLVGAPTINEDGTITDNKSNNVLYKLIVGNDPSFSKNSFGHVLANEIYFSFLTDDIDPKFRDYPEDGSGVFYMLNFGTIKECYSGKLSPEDAKALGCKENMSFVDMVHYTTVVHADISPTTSREFVFEFNGLFSLVFGIFTALLLVSYVIEVGIRVIQLAYLQLIAPIPIFTYVSDPDGTFKIWVKQCVTTYLDLFIRLAIIYFIVLFSGEVLDFFDDISRAIEHLGPWPKLIILLGLLLFAKKVPALLKELFPGLGGGAAGFNYALKSPKKIWNDYIAGAPVIGKPIGWLGNKAVGLSKKAAVGTLKGAGKLVTKPVVAGVNHVKNNISERKKERAEIRADQIKAKKEAAKSNAQYEFGKKYVDKYKNGGDISQEFSGAYKQSFDNVNKHKKNVSLIGGKLKNAELELENAKKTGDVKAIKAAQLKVDSLKAQYSNAEGMLEQAKSQHALNMRKKEFAKYAKIENAYNHAKSVDEFNDASKSLDSDNNKDVVGAVANNVGGVGVGTNNVVGAIVGGDNASDDLSDYAKRYNQTTAVGANSELYDRVNKITGVDMENASDHGAPTAQNSLLAELADKAHQKELQEEYMNRKDDNYESSDYTRQYDQSTTVGQVEEDSSRNRKGLFSESNSNRVNTKDESNFLYASQEEYDERIEYATERLQDLSQTGASQQEIDNQLKVLENLKESKRLSKLKDDEIDDFYDRLDDGYGGQ